MEIIDKQLDCALINPQIISDLRGSFTIPFSVQDLRLLGLKWNDTYQLNHSFTRKKGTVRGLNYQDPFPQAKVIRCIQGSLYSVGVCLTGENRGKFVGYVLTAEHMEEMYIPRNYAHGFISLEDNIEMEYLTDNLYSYESAKSIKWNTLGIDWTVGGKVEIREDLLSDKNRNASELL